MRPDAVVLDIDGVLVDTSDSYHRAIVETVDAVCGETIPRERTQLFKDAGGFNNDWELTEAVALVILARQQGVAVELDAFTSVIERRGGGLSAAKDELEERLSTDTWETVRAACDGEALRRSFQWCYLGPDRYHDLETSPPPAVKPTETGLFDREAVFLDDRTRKWIQDQPAFGILTGRPRAEAEIALDRVDLDPPEDHIMAMEDWAGGKPDPDGLRTLARRCDADTVVYAGDELDDVRTAVNAHAVDGSRSYLGIGVQTGGVTGAAGRERFGVIGAAAVIDTINELPDTVATLPTEE